jgi:hypothetical protein
MDRIAVYASAPEGHFTLTELLARLGSMGLDVQPKALRQSIARLELAFVLFRDGQHFRYQVPLQREQILAEDTEYLLRAEIRQA